MREDFKVFPLLVRQASFSIALWAKLASIEPPYMSPTSSNPSNSRNGQMPDP